ncbi:PAS domain S-box protein [Leptospira noguchii str. 1993005606]|uniref:histidine kinase n=4 Tax=Leptospira noguchii TaxID=28182 RepID=M6YFG9_9LEPT|nr:PAS domain S-box protein [Leptospira noguchii str. 2006001870]EMM98983.1 PAS domain S-box protein [Leptospira noguchii str. 2007001578]EMO41918.1 PAS domain S-box protein [Leptospira noguchii serovar Autumnalis str. ZUN142]EMO90596.1 PAS domain S-box protein [Leptospira noguchii str. 2001034031]EPE84609.1 PAS domain S-box protein [Leptospira noguchii str. 1993005606]
MLNWMKNLDSIEPISIKHYQFFFDLSQDGLAIHSEGKILRANDALIRMLGYDSIEEVIGKPVLQFVHPRSQSVVKERIQKMSQEGTVVEAIEEEFIRKDGSTLFVEVAATAFFENEVQYFQVVVKNINFRKRAELELERLRSKLKITQERLLGVIEGTKDAICAVDIHFRVIAFNSSFELSFWKLYGKKIEEGNLLPELILDPEERSVVIENWSRALRGEVYTTERVMQGLVQDSAIFEISYSSIRDSSHNLIGATQIIRDITERKYDEEKLKKTLEEKEVMLKEIHHRVKNNLQVVASLLSLQSEHYGNERISRILKECERRIQSMALIHKELYQSENITKIDFYDYLNTLLVSLLHSFGKEKKVEFKISSKPNFVSIETAIPLGLIVNELATNSLKYAFSNGKDGLISVHLRLDVLESVLEVEDNGIGMPEEFDLDKSESLGLKLVEILARQLRGKFILLPSRKEKGTKFQVVFKG